MAIHKDKFLDVVNVVWTNSWYIFNSKFYQQTDGVVMGGPAFSTTEISHMSAHEQTGISAVLYPPKVWEIFIMMTLIPSLKVHAWKTFSIPLTFFIKTLILLDRKKVMESYEILERSLYWYISSLRTLTKTLQLLPSSKL